MGTKLPFWWRPVALSFFTQGAKSDQILDVFVHVLRFGCLKAAWVILKSQIVNDAPKTLLSNFALTNMSVPIDARTQIGFGIIQMKRQNLFQANV